MTDIIPTPEELPAFRLREAHRPRGARRPLLVIGEVDRSLRGWSRTAQALEPQRFYIGPEVRGDFDQSLPDILRWRTASLLFDMAGILVPRWHELNPRQMDQIRVLANHAPTSADEAKTLRRVSGQFPVLPIFWMMGSQIRDADSRLSGTRRSESIVDELASQLPADVTDSPALRTLLPDSGVRVRDLEAAWRAAEALRAGGFSDRQIGTYLATYGYVNAKGVVGAWHHARLAEVWDGRHE